MPDGSDLPRVAFNAALLSASRDHRAAGIHCYICGLLGALAERDDVAMIALGTDGEARELLPAGLRVHTSRAFVRQPVGRIAWEQLALPFECARYGAQLLHCPAYAVPLGGTVPAVVTVHDMSFFRVPGAVPRARGFYLRAATRLATARARAVIAVSEFTRRELVALLDVAPEKVHVVANGIDPAFSPAAAESVAAFRRRRGLPERFVLAVGTLEPRKNLGVLLDAYGLLVRTLDRAPGLIVAGAAGWGPNDLGHRIEAGGLADHVQVLGYVPPEELPLLYCAAEVFAFPSRYEGFGMPLAEAMACGTPAVASAAASMAEVAGSAALLVAPHDVRGWAAALRSVLEDEQRSQTLSEAGKLRARRFTWQRSARQTASVYAQVLGSTAARTRRLEIPHRGA